MGGTKKGDLQGFQDHKFAYKKQKLLIAYRVSETEILFYMVGTHDEVFDDIRRSPFSLKEAAEYLDVAEITLRRWIKAGKLNFNRIGRNFVFDPDELKAFKKNKMLKRK